MAATVVADCPLAAACNLRGACIRGRASRKARQLSQIVSDGIPDDLDWAPELIVAERRKVASLRGSVDLPDFGAGAHSPVIGAFPRQEYENCTSTTKVASM